MRRQVSLIGILLLAWHAPAWSGEELHEGVLFNDLGDNNDDDLQAMGLAVVGELDWLADGASGNITYRKASGSAKFCQFRARATYGERPATALCLQITYQDVWDQPTKVEGMVEGIWREIGTLGGKGDNQWKKVSLVILPDALRAQEGFYYFRLVAPAGVTGGIPIDYLKLCRKGAEDVEVGEEPLAPPVGDLLLLIDGSDPLLVQAKSPAFRSSGWRVQFRGVLMPALAVT